MLKLQKAQLIKPKAVSKPEVKPKDRWIKAAEVEPVTNVPTKEETEAKLKFLERTTGVTSISHTFNTTVGRKRPEDYTDEEKVAVLVALRESAYDFSLTSKKTGVKATTIREWKRQYGKDFEQLVRETYYDDLRVIAEELDQKYKESLHKFQKAAHVVKMITLNRIFEIIPMETNLRFLNETLRTLSEITDTELEDVKSKKTTNQFLQIVQNQIIQTSNGKENPTEEL